jgi:hypothetical protein
MGQLFGFSEQMARTNGRHRPSVSPMPTVRHQVFGWSRTSDVVT